MYDKKTKWPKADTQRKRAEKAEALVEELRLQLKYPDPEDMPGELAAKYCPFNDPLHFHHDGCPSEWAMEERISASEKKNTKEEKQERKRHTIGYHVDGGIMWGGFFEDSDYCVVVGARRFDTSPFYNDSHYEEPRELVSKKDIVCMSLNSLWKAEKNKDKATTKSEEEKKKIVEAIKDFSKELC